MEMKCACVSAAYIQDWSKVNQLVNPHCLLVDQNLQLDLGKVSCAVVTCLPASSAYLLHLVGASVNRTVQCLSKGERWWVFLFVLPSTVIAPNSQMGYLRIR